MPVATGLDHVGLVVRDLDAAAEALARLGFAMTPRTSHHESDGSGRPAPAGSANCCAMFENGYLEVIAPEDVGAPTPNGRLVRGFLEAGGGLRILALACADADAAAADISRRDHAVSRREISRPLEDGAEARFALVVPEELQEADTTTVLIQHRTPDLLWRRDVMGHPNDATGLHEILFCCTAPEATVRRYAAVLREDAALDGGLWTVRLASGRLRFGTAEAVARELGGTGDFPFMAAFGVSVPDVAAVERRMADNAIATRRNGEAVVVPAASACGAACIFRGA